LLTVTAQGLYCAAGDFHIDPSSPVDHALITHAHSDHARTGCRAYLCAREGADVLRVRVGGGASIATLPYGETTRLRDVAISFHPAGHILGSAQIRLEHQGEVWVVSGDYKTQPDPTCTPVEPVRCHTFLTESTFALPIYRWPDPASVFAEINAWWQANQEQRQTSMLYAYSLGKAQRVLAGVDPSLGPIAVHRAVREFLPAYAAAGVSLPSVESAAPEPIRGHGGRALVIAPMGGFGPDWIESIGDTSTRFASGWMLLRKGRGQPAVDRGFVLSDHADWAGLLDVIRATGATRIIATHGTTVPLVRWLGENGWQAETLPRRPDRAPRPQD